MVHVHVGIGHDSSSHDGLPGELGASCKKSNTLRTQSAGIGHVLLVTSNYDGTGCQSHRSTYMKCGMWSIRSFARLMRGLQHLLVHHRQINQSPCFQAKLP